MNGPQILAVRGTNELVQTLCGTETSWSHANDENVNITVTRKSAIVAARAIVAFAELRSL
jgi:hypothetical protein